MQVSLNLLAYQHEHDKVYALRHERSAQFVLGQVKHGEHK